MTFHRHHSTSRGTNVDPAGRATAGRWARQRRAEFARARPLAQRLRPADEPESVWTALQLETLWDRHGASIYALACALLGEETAAARAVTLGMADLARSDGSASADDARRSWARHVYRRSQELARETSSTPDLPPDLPPTMVWLGQLARLERSCLALCLFGGHTRREAAALLGVPPATVADLLTEGLREVGRLAAGGTAAHAWAVPPVRGSLAPASFLTRSTSTRESR